MEETSNGKPEESPNVGTYEGDKKQEVIESAAGFNPEVESTEGAADGGKSELVGEMKEGDDVEEKSPDQTGNLDIAEDEELVSDTTPVPVETLVSSPGEEPGGDVQVKLCEVVEPEPDGANKDEELPPVSGIIDEAPPLAASVGMKEEKALQQSVGVSVPATEVEQKGIDETMQLPSVDASSWNLDEQEIPVLKENPGEPSAPADSTGPSEEAPVTETRDVSPEATNAPSTGNPRTSWKSCCGLFQVLKGSVR